MPKSNIPLSVIVEREIAQEQVSETVARRHIARVDIQIDVGWLEAFLGAVWQRWRR